MFRRLAVLAAACTGGVAMMATPAMAGGSPHFIHSATNVGLVGTSLVANFKEAGLSSGQTETVNLQAHAVTTYECVNGGNKNPSASNKTNQQSDPKASGQFKVQNGNIIGSLTLVKPAPTNSFSCPSGQVETFVGVVYSNVRLVDTTSGAVFTPSQTTFSAINPQAP